jgi:PAS domain S-box-containing protein
MANEAPVMIWLSDTQRGCTWFNQPWLDFVGRSLDQELGFGWAEGVHPDDAPRCLHLYTQAFDARTPFWMDYRLRRADGRYAWVADHGIPLHEDGEFIGYIGSVIEITERKASELALAESEERFRVALESSTVPFVIVRAARDANSAITDFEWSYINPTALNTLMVSTDVIGRRVDEVFPGLWQQLPDLFATFVRTVETGVPGDLAGHSTMFGQPVWIRSICVKLGDGLAAWFLDETEQRRTEAALREADRRKDEFVATLAHELRNPLAPIRQASALARLPGATGAQIAWAHEVIERQVRHMSLLLDDLLDISRIGRGRLELRVETIELGSVVAAAVESASPLIEARRHTLTLELPGRPVRLQADALRLAQVLSNLLTNAAKYSEPGGWIRLSADEQDGHVRLRVADGGVGLRAEAIPKLFEMFSQVKSAIDRTEGGLGIGLALSKGLVDLHGGTLTAFSQGIGHGSEFTVRIPIGPARSPSAAAEPRAEPPPLPAGRRVLVADDNRDAAASLAMLLEIAGHEVQIAHDGAQAFELAASFRPDLALLDIGMPKLNGYELAERIRQQPWGAAMRLIAVTGWGQDEDKRRGAAAGFDDHLTKPIDPAILPTLLRPRSG